MNPRDSLDSTDEDRYNEDRYNEDRYDEKYDLEEDSGIDSDDKEPEGLELKLKLDTQEEGLSIEQFLKYSVRQSLPKSYVLIYFRHSTAMGFAA